MCLLRGGGERERESKPVLAQISPRPPPETVWRSEDGPSSNTQRPAVARAGRPNPLAPSPCFAREDFLYLACGECIILLHDLLLPSSPLPTSSCWEGARCKILLGSRGARQSDSGLAGTLRPDRWSQPRPRLRIRCKHRPGTPSSTHLAPRTLDSHLVQKRPTVPLLTWLPRPFPDARACQRRGAVGAAHPRGVEGRGWHAIVLLVEQQPLLLRGCR